MNAARRNRWWAAAALLAGFLAVTVVVGGWSMPLDERWLLLMIDHEVSLLVSFVRFLWVVGEFPTAFVVALLVGLVFIPTKSWWLCGRGERWSAAPRSSRRLRRT